MRVRLLAWSLWFVTLGFLANQAHAFSPNTIERILGELPTDLTVLGNVVEEIARLELYETFPASQYVIRRGIAYYNSSKILGELDLVVFERATGKVVYIAEVKSGNSAGKARDQIQRFEEAWEKGRVRGFVLTHHESVRFPLEAFEGKWTAETISTAGNLGFDRYLNLTRAQASAMRKRLEQLQEVKTMRYARRKGVDMTLEEYLDHLLPLHMFDFEAAINRLRCRAAF